MVNALRWERLSKVRVARRREMATQGGSEQQPHRAHEFHRRRIERFVMMALEQYHAPALPIGHQWDG